MSELSSHIQLSKSAQEIRSLRPSEANSLSRIQHELDTSDHATADRLIKDAGRLVEQGGRAWLLRCQETVTGYASILPTPGLPGLFD